MVKGEGGSADVMVLDRLLCMGNAGGEATRVVPPAAVHMLCVVALCMLWDVEGRPASCNWDWFRGLCVSLTAPTVAHETLVAPLLRLMTATRLVEVLAFMGGNAVWGRRAGTAEGGDEQETTKEQKKRHKARHRALATVLEVLLHGLDRFRPSDKEVAGGCILLQSVLATNLEALLAENGHDSEAYHRLTALCQQLDRRARTRVAATHSAGSRRWLNRLVDALNVTVHHTASGIHSCRASDAEQNNDEERDGALLLVREERGSGSGSDRQEDAGFLQAARVLDTDSGRVEAQQCIAAAAASWTRARRSCAEQDPEWAALLPTFVDVCQPYLPRALRRDIFLAHPIQPSTLKFTADSATRGDAAATADGDAESSDASDEDGNAEIGGGVEDADENEDEDAADDDDEEEDFISLKPTTKTAVAEEKADSGDEEGAAPAPSPDGSGVRTRSRRIRTRRSVRAQAVEQETEQEVAEEDSSEVAEIGRTNKQGRDDSSSGSDDDSSDDGSDEEDQELDTAERLEDAEALNPSPESSPRRTVRTQSRARARRSRQRQAAAEANSDDEDGQQEGEEENEEQEKKKEQKGKEEEEPVAAASEDGGDATTAPGTATRRSTRGSTRKRLFPDSAAGVRRSTRRRTRASSASECL